MIFKVTKQQLDEIDWTIKLINNIVLVNLFMKLSVIMNKVSKSHCDAKRLKGWAKRKGVSWREGCENNETMGEGGGCFQGPWGRLAWGGKGVGGCAGRGRRRGACTVRSSWIPRGDRV